MKKFLLTIVALVFTFTLFACNKPNVQEDAIELNMAVAHNSTKTSISFKDSNVTGTGLTLADGATYNTGDLKPVWKELEKIQNIKFNDVYSGAKSADAEYQVWKNLSFEGVDVVVGNASSMAEDGKANKIVNLADHLDDMPNFSKFLNDNPIVYLSVISDTDTGSIYYAPYFDGYDDIEKYFLMRTDWLVTLLDGEGDFTASTSDTLPNELAYQPYMPTTGTVEIESLNAAGTAKETITKNYDTTYGNIVSYMNANVTSTTTGVELVNMFRDYIDAAYNGKYGTKRSDLFAGYNACWDADELVALLRCVITNTQALTDQNDVKVTGLFPREAALNRTSDLFALVSLFGARGWESRNDYLYFDAAGNLQDARGSLEFVESINKINQLYSEGLILQNFDTRTDTINKTMFQNNQGFMLYDYCQTQCLYNEDKDTLAKEEDFNLSPIMTPVAKWNDGSNADGVYMRFTESWRSVKTNGWCIPVTCTGKKLEAAIKLFDYMYSEEGAILMSYGPDAWRSGGTITYKGEQIPELSVAATNELWNLAGGNYTNYARQFLGSTLPIGFVKDQGMEYQCTTDGGKAGAAIVSAALAAGTIKHVTPNITENLFYTMVPTVLPTTAQQDQILSEYGAIGSGGIYSKSKDRYNIYIEIIKNGFGSGTSLNNTHITTMPANAQELVEKHNAQENGLGGYAYITTQRSAWDKILAYYNTNIK